MTINKHYPTDSDFLISLEVVCTTVIIVTSVIYCHDCHVGKDKCTIRTMTITTIRLTITAITIRIAITIMIMTITTITSMKIAMIMMAIENNNNDVQMQ